MQKLYRKFVCNLNILKQKNKGLQQLELIRLWFDRYFKVIVLIDFYNEFILEYNLIWSSTSKYTYFKTIVMSYI